MHEKYVFFKKVVLQTHLPVKLSSFCVPFLCPALPYSLSLCASLLQGGADI